jgi:DNA-binding response OmpR family regulator
MMPVMNGFEVIGKVRSDDEYSQMRIVVLSALNASESVVEALTMGADEFITKPITMQKLYDSVSKQFELILAMGADAKEG